MLTSVLKGLQRFLIAFAFLRPTGICLMKVNVEIDAIKDRQGVIAPAGRHSPTFIVVIPFLKLLSSMIYISDRPRKR